MSKIMVSVSGWCEADPDKVRFQYIGEDDNAEQYITGTEWLSLDEEEREDYILECTGTAFATALNGEYDYIDIEVGE